MKAVYICSAVRTPMGSFGGVLSGISATKLGSIAIEGALAKAGVDIALINEVFMGNVCSANLGQAPARQAAIGAGLSNTIPCTTINKVCSSGIKSIMIGAQTIMSGYNDIVVAGGMENMSSVPFYMEKARWGYKYGHSTLIDGLQKDDYKMPMIIKQWESVLMRLQVNIVSLEKHKMNMQSTLTKELQQLQNQGKFKGEIVSVFDPTKER